MVPQTYGDILVMTVAAIGAALVLGTGAAIVRFRRTGLFPGQSATDEPDRTRAGYRGAVVKLAIGAVLLVWGLAVLFVT